MSVLTDTRAEEMCSLAEKYAQCCMAMLDVKDIHREFDTTDIDDCVELLYNKEFRRMPPRGFCALVIEAVEKMTKRRLL